MSDHGLHLEDSLGAALLAGMFEVSLREISSKSGKVLRTLQGFDPVATAASFGVLLLRPEIQSNCLRIETLVHFAVAACNGHRKPDEKTLEECFQGLARTTAARFEDPAEDVFVGSISTDTGNFLLLEGIWEGATFLTQRFVNMLQGMPSTEGYRETKASIYALLTISNEVCRRAGLVRNQLGNDNPTRSLPEAARRAGRFERKLLYFSSSELLKLGIEFDQLTPFITSPQIKLELLKGSLGHSPLERRPLLLSSDGVVLALPTATSAAIRRFLIERITDAGLRRSFVRALAQEYSSNFRRTPLLGRLPNAPIQFQELANRTLIANLSTSVDVGRHLQFIFVADSLEGFEESGLASVGHSQDVDNLIQRIVRETAEKARQDADFVAGLTIIVGCGVGRARAHTLSAQKMENWRIEHISAYDLETLSWVPQFDPLSLWRVLDARDSLPQHNVHLENANGLLNMVAWSRLLNGHVVPHEQLPDAFASTGPNFIIINQNGLRDLRHEVFAAWDPHVALTPKGDWVAVRKEGVALFEEDRRAPYYLTEPDGKSKNPLGLWQGKAQTWWVDIQLNVDGAPHWDVDRCRMACVWLRRVATVAQDLLGELSCPVLWIAKFNAIELDTEAATADISDEQIRQDIQVEVDAHLATVTTITGATFERGMSNAANDSERALAEALFSGVCQLAGLSIDENLRGRLLEKIIPDKRARQIHVFHARSFRDYSRDYGEKISWRLADDDHAAVRLGLGWRIRPRSSGSTIEGKENCTQFLNSAVRLLESEVCQELRKFDREETLRWLLCAYEAASIDRQHWRRTAPAMLSLHENKEEARETIGVYFGQQNAATLATRLVAELALCECPLNSRRKPGSLDLLRLMAKVLAIVDYGGWSDAVRWDAIEPLVHITPLGDIRMKMDNFVREIVAPFVQAHSDAQVEHADQTYDENIQEPPIVATVEHVFEPDFIIAWAEEAGATLDQARTFVEAIEEEGLRQKKIILRVSRSEILTLLDGKLQRDVAERLVDFLSLSPRENWLSVPKGFDPRDIHPWRFRRRLTPVRKPLLEFSATADSTYLVAPGLLRESLWYLIENYRRGDFPTWQLSGRMRKWAGKASNERGARFTERVAERCRKDGWVAYAEIRITELIGKSLDHDLGDVDVLAWNPTSERLLVMECKDLHYRKTYGEIAEQLSDFRGQIRPNGKPDYLLRHLKRVHAIQEHLPEVLKFVGGRGTASVESHLVFKNPVPMQFARNISSLVRVSTLKTLNI